MMFSSTLVAYVFKYEWSSRKFLGQKEDLTLIPSTFDPHWRGARIRHFAEFLVIFDHASSWFPSTLQIQ